MAYQAVERGMLSDRIMLNDFGFAENDLRSKKPEFKDIVRKEVAAYVKEVVQPVAKKLELSITAVALKWLFDYYGVTAALYGISKMSYFDDVLAADNALTLPDEDIQTLNKGYWDFSAHIANTYGKSVNDFFGVIPF